MKSRPSRSRFFAFLFILVVLGVAFVVMNSEDLQGRLRFPAAVQTNRGEAVQAFMLDSGQASLTCPGLAQVFPDVPSAKSYFCGVTEAYNLGYVQGQPNGTFGGDDLVTRSEAVKFAYTIYQIPNFVPAVPTFTDVQPGDWYYEYIESLHHAGAFAISSGDFRPNDVLNRRDLQYAMRHL